MKPSAIFILSALVAMLFLLLERSLGINWDFHPDAVAYITDYGDYTDDIAKLPNNLYFFISELTGGDVNLLIGINIILYATCNVLACSKLEALNRMNAFTPFDIAIFKLVFLIQPYRIHLCAHALKDTLIIFLLLVITTNQFRHRVLSISIITITRLSSILYLVAFIPRKYVFKIFVFVLIILLLSNQDLLGFFTSRNDADMGGRDFNVIPAFSDYGLYGSVARGVIWPTLLVSGGFMIVSPALSFLPIAAEILFGRITLLSFTQAKFNWAAIMLSFGIMAIMVTSFTAYIRYCYPLICVMPLLGAQFHREKI